MEKNNTREAKRRRFHQVLLNLYHPPSPPRSPPSRPPQLSEDELVAMVCGDMELNFDQGDESNDASETSVAPEDDGEPKKLTRAQRKRLRKRKVKEASSVRRKIIGPLLLPPTEQDLPESSEKLLHENPCEPG